MLLPPGALLGQTGSCLRSSRSRGWGWFPGKSETGKKKLLGKACHQLHAPAEEWEPRESLTAPSSPTRPVLCPSLLHSRGQSMSFSMPCLSSRRVPSHTSVSRLPAPGKLHSPRIPVARDTLLLPLPSWSTACGRAPGETTRRWMGAVLFSRWASSRGGRRTFFIQQNTPRCHAPLTRKCCYTVWSQFWRRCRITSSPLCFLLPHSLHMKNYGYAASFLLAASLGCVFCSWLDLQRLAASSFSRYFCALPWHSVKSQSPCRNRVVVFISSVFSSLPSLWIPPAAHWEMHVLPSAPAAS